MNFGHGHSSIIKKIQTQAQKQGVEFSEQQLHQLEEVVTTLAEWEAYTKEFQKESEKAKDTFLRVQKIKAQSIQNPRSYSGRLPSLKVRQNQLRKALSIETKIYTDAMHFLEESERYVEKLMPDIHQENHEIRSMTQEIGQLQNAIIRLRNMIVDINKCVNEQGQYIADGLMKQPEAFRDAMLQSMAKQADYLRETMLGAQKVKLESQREFEKLVNKYTRNKNPKQIKQIKESLFQGALFLSIGYLLTIPDVTGEVHAFAALSAIILSGTFLSFGVGKLIKMEIQTAIQQSKAQEKANAKIRTDSSYAKYLEAIERLQNIQMQLPQ